MKKVIIIIFAFFCFSSNSIIGRSPFRKKDKDQPRIAIRWKGHKKSISHTNWAYKKYPIFTCFNRDYFYNHLLPKDKITYRWGSSDSVNSYVLNQLIQDLLKELKSYKKSKRKLKNFKKKFKHFTLLQDKNFNYDQCCGLLVVKCNDYPFVVKLFIETPATFIDPYCKGFESQFFFYMSGGVNRHIAGLMRVKNLELVNQQIQEHPRWQNKVITPRKWYWIPKRPRWIEINGYNIGGEKEISTLIPGTYAIIADVIDTKEDAPLLSMQQKSELIMELCMDLHLFVDPHADNFVLKYNKETNDYKISIVDTEHFPSIVGLKEEPFFNNHLEWYLYLGAKYFQDAFLQTKCDRRKAQNMINPCEVKW